MNLQKKILFITHYSSLHGANLSLLELIIGLRETHRIDPIVLLPSKGRFINDLEKNNIEYVIIKFRPWKWSWNKNRVLNSVKNYIFQEISVRKLSKCFKDADIDIIHTNSSVTPIGVYLSKRISAKHVWHVREFGELDFALKDIYTKSYNNKWLNHSDGIIYISKAIKKHFKSIYDFKDPKDYVIYNGIDYSKFPEKPIRKNDGIFKFVCCAYNSEGKNQLELLQAVNILKNKTSSLFTVTLVGGYSDAEGYREKLLKYTKDNNLETYISILDYVENIASIYEKCDVGILCSKGEGFGRVVAEYMYFKMPAIVSNSGALPELIDNKRNGFIYELGDIKALSSLMLWTLNNPDEVSKIGEKAKNKAIINYEINRVVDQVHKVYTEILNRKK